MSTMDAGKVLGAVLGLALAAGVAAGAAVPEADGDRDGVPDAMDACPYTPPGAAVDARGCALDDDADGVANGVDQCPGTAPGAVVDAGGCSDRQRASRPVRWATAEAPATADHAAVVVMAPVMPELAATATLLHDARPAPDALPAAGREKVDRSVDGKVYWQVGFAPGSADLRERELAGLARAAPDLRRALALMPQLRLEVAGRADPGQNPDSAATLGRARAQVVRAYLLAQGVPGRRMTPMAAPDGAVSGDGQRQVEVRMTCAGMLPCQWQRLSGSVSASPIHQQNHGEQQ